MKSTVNSKQAIFTTMLLLALSIFVLTPFNATLQAQEGVVYLEKDLNIVGVFPSEEEAQTMAQLMNQGPLANSLVEAEVSWNEAASNYEVYLQTTEQITHLEAGCMLTASPKVVAAGQKVEFAWQIDKTKLNCGPEDAGCGDVVTATLQDKSVEGDSVSVAVEETATYVFSAAVKTVSDGYDLDIKDSEVGVKTVACTTEVKVTNWFKWVLWKLFKIEP